MTRRRIHRNIAVAAFGWSVTAVTSITVINALTGLLSTVGNLSRMRADYIIPYPLQVVANMSGYVQDSGYRAAIATAMISMLALVGAWKLANARSGFASFLLLAIGAATVLGPRFFLGANYPGHDDTQFLALAAVVVATGCVVAYDGFRTIGSPLTARTIAG